MSFPVLYAADDTEFDGMLVLTDCVSCEVTEERNGAFELSMKYPVGGIHYSEITSRAVIMAKPDPHRSTQYFRVYSVTKPMNGTITVSARHISYELTGVPVMPFSAERASEVMAKLTSVVASYFPSNPYLFSAHNYGSGGELETFVPMSVRAILATMVERHGGELEFDNFVVRLTNDQWSSRGEDRGVKIAYGKNLIDLKQEENCSDVYTGIFPYWNAEEGVNLVTLYDKDAGENGVVYADGDFGYSRIKIVDFSSEFDVEPTADELREAAKNYITENEIGVPKVSLTVSFTQLDIWDEYKNAPISERVSLCDTVTVIFSALGIETSAKVTKLVYDVLKDRVKSAVIGNIKKNVADTIATAGASTNAVQITREAVFA